MKFSSEPPTAALFFVGKSRRRDCNFRARSKISIETKNFGRDRIFLIVGPSGYNGARIRCFFFAISTIFLLIFVGKTCISEHLSGTGDSSQRDSRESIRANHSQLRPLFLKLVRPIRTDHSNFRFARITRFARIVRIDSRESRH